LLTPVIIAGGSGTRLWPLSRQLYPKQFLPLLSEETMFQQTIERLHGLDWHELIVVCNEEHRFLAAEQLRRVGIKNAKIILEPVPKNTAPAIALAAYEACEKDKNAILLVLPADHVIKDHKKFQASVKIATKAVKNGKLVTFGIIPDSPKTGYGYIRRGEKLEEGIFSVDAFVEKPDVRKAHEYQKSGMYFWNSGMFLFSAKSYIDELQKFAPTIASTCEKAISKAEKDLDFLRIARDVFQDCPSDSIDFSVMEKTTKAAVVPFNAGWSDIGSWNALLEVCEKDKKGNSIKGDVVDIDTENCLIYAEDRLGTTLGVKNLIIVETKDAFLVMEKSRSEEIKTIVEQLKAMSRTEIVNHREVHRPWGVYDSIAKG
jgi:mannose-1-phosphate guanylyltransferase